MPTENPRVQTTFPPALHARILDAAKARNTSKSQIVREMVEAYIDDYDTSDDLLEDPFRYFTEWASDEDEEAYKDL